MEFFQYSAQKKQRKKKKTLQMCDISWPYINSMEILIECLIEDAEFMHNY